MLKIGAAATRQLGFCPRGRELYALFFRRPRADPKDASLDGSSDGVRPFLRQDTCALTQFSEVDKEVLDADLEDVGNLKEEKQAW